MYNLKINYGPEIDGKLCNGCGNCYKYCPQDVFGWDKEKNVPTVLYAGECDMCCFCEILCPEVAIDVKVPVHNLLDFGIAPVDYKKVSDTYEG
jgi:NAD-dependent dihydropyrimidine dehydrogenase PreA subunit